MKTEAVFKVGVFDDSAKPDLALTTTAQLQPFSTLHSFVKDEVEWNKWATLEKGRFVLDNTMHPFPDDMGSVEDWGAWTSAISDENGEFAAPHVFTMDFTQDHACVGLTFHFDEPVGEWASHALVQWADANGTIVANEMVYFTGANHFLARRVSRFRKIIATFYGTSKPHRYFKLANIDFGELVVLDGGKVTSAKITKSVSPTGEALAVNQIELEAIAHGSSLDPMDPQNLTSGLRARQRVDGFTYVEGVLQDSYHYYLNAWKKSANHKIHLTAVDLVGVIGSDPYPGGIFDTSLGWLAADILGEFPFEVDEALRGTPVRGWLPATTRREALRELARATRTIIDTSSGNIVRFLPRSEQATGEIPAARKFMGYSSMEGKNTVTAVAVTAHEYQPGTEAQKLYSAKGLAAGSYTTAFKEPCHSYSIVGGSITTHHPNHVAFATNGGDVEIYGYRYIDNTYTVRLENPDVPAGLQENVVAVEDATLISPQAAPGIAQDMLQYYSHTYTQTLRVVPKRNENLGDTVVVASFGGNKVRGIIEERVDDLANGHVSDMTASVYLVPTYWRYYVGEKRTGSGGIL